MVFAIISSLSITSQLLLALAGARTSVTSWVTYISALEWKTNKQKSNMFFHSNFPILSEFYPHYNWNCVNHIIFSVEVSKKRIHFFEGTKENILHIFWAIVSYENNQIFYTQITNSTTNLIWFSPTRAVHKRLVGLNANLTFDKDEQFVHNRLSSYSCSKFSLCYRQLYQLHFKN